MMASQAIRRIPARPAPIRRGAHAVRRQAPAAGRAPAARSRRAAPSVTWDLRVFGAVAGAIVIGFALAVLYLGQATAVSASGYEAQRLAAARDELRRQNALLEVRLTTLESPARIAADATRLGMTRVSYVPVIAAAPPRALTR